MGNDFLTNFTEPSYKNAKLDTKTPQLYVKSFKEPVDAIEESKKYVLLPVLQLKRLQMC